MESIDLTADPLLSLIDAAPLAGVSRSTLLRWIRVGYRGVKLRAWKKPGGWQTRQSAILDFEAVLAELDGAETVSPTAQAGYEWAVASLRARGIL